MLRGENYLIRVEGKKSLMGFYTTRFIEAESLEKAENLAVDTIRKDKNIENVILNKFWHKKPMIYFEEEYEIEEKEMENSHGYTWFPMES